MADAAGDKALGAPIVPIDEDEAPLQVKPFRGAAAGVEAIVQTARHTLEQMGVARGVGALLRVNKPEGFDCPGCAWPDPDERTPAEFCENGAKAVAEEATTARITPEFFAEWSVEALRGKSGYWLGQQGRLTEPMLLDEGATHYTPIGWDAAFALIGESLRGLKTPDEAVFYTSGRTSNEAAFLYQLFARSLGTNNLPDCSNMCHESSGKGLTETIGVGKGTVSLDDFEQAELILVIGQNPGTNHPRMLTALQKAVRAGARVITINPLREPGMERFKHPQEVVGLLGRGTRLSERLVRVRVGGDLALLTGVLKAMVTAEALQPGAAFDHHFIQTYTDGFEKLWDHVQTFPWEALEAQSGVSREEIEALAQDIMGADRIIACWAMGLTQHKHGVANIQAVTNVLLARGAIGKPGAGACPVRGHSNVQGDRTMGIWESPKAAFLDRLDAEFGITSPREHGLNTVEAIKAMHAGEASVFVAMGGNFLSATPDTDYTAEALRRCALTVQVSTKLNRSHLITGKRALILPCLGRTEIDVQGGRKQFVSVENSMGVVHMSRGHLPPASPKLLSEPQIVARMAEATLGRDHAVRWAWLAEDYDRIRAHIAQVIPGFEDYNARIVRPNGFVLPNPARERDFRTKTGKARFKRHPLPDLELEPGHFLLMTVRSHDQYNTTIYGHDDRYRGLYNNRRVVLIHPDDLRESGFEQGQAVHITSHFRGEQRTAQRFTLVPYAIPRGCLATYFPEANVLVPVDSYADKSFTPTSKSIRVTLHPV